MFGVPEMADEGLAVLVSRCTPPDPQMLSSLELLVCIKLLR